MGGNTSRGLTDKGCILDLWGSFAGLSAKEISLDDLIGTNLEELDIAFGVGGFGNNKAQAVESIDEFVSARTIAGVIPADGHCISDFISTDMASEFFLYIAAAIGFSGRPSLYTERGFKHR